MNKRAQAKRRKNTKINPTYSSSTSDEKKVYTNVIDSSIDKAYEMWNDIKDRVKNDPEFTNMKDSDKLEIYQNKFKEFYSAYPIVCRYMVCLGQYSAKAFKKYLLKCKNVTHTIEERQNREFMSDQWVKRQADYIRFLWEAYQKQHYKEKDAQGIWQHAYKTLTKEFSDFKSQEKQIEDRLKKDDNQHKKELVKELIARVSNNEQKLDENSAAKLIKILEEQSYKQNKKKTLTELKENTSEIPPSRTTRGSVKEK